jgi:sarcosine oxidase subunit beta
VKFSFVSLAREGLTGHLGWTPQWRSPDPKPAYDVVIVGGGGHGLATAYYLAEEYGVANVAVLEKGWLGGGNTGRNTTIVRSNYLWEASEAIYAHSHRLWTTLAEALNYNVMFSPRGVLQLAHNRHEAAALKRQVHANRLAGVEGEWVNRAQAKAVCPILNTDPGIRYPVVGGALQRTGGTARHDAVAWGYARAADRLGVDIIQNCAVTGFDIEGGRVVGVQTTQGPVSADVFGMAVAGNSGVLAGLAGFKLPLQSYTLQAMVSEPLKPMLNTIAFSSATGTYVSQSSKGELVFGAGLDVYPSYARRGGLPVTQAIVAAMTQLFPAYRRLKVMRQWGGTCDVCWDYSPIIGPSPVENLFLNCGWGTGGFKGTPVGGYMLAWLMATGRHHELSAPFDLSRFTAGRLIDEVAGAGIAH